MTTAATDDYDEELAEALEQIALPKDVYDFDEELAQAGRFTGRFGPLYDLPNGPYMARIWTGDGDAAWCLLAHWTNESGRNPAYSNSEYADHQKVCEACAYLEDACDIWEELEETPCGKCGGGPGNHDVLPAQSGIPEAVCHEPWERQEPLAAPAGDVGPDNQVGAAYNARWVAPLVDGTFAVITRTYYLVNAGGTIIAERDDEYLYCTDPADPGSTEIGSDGAVSQIEDYDPSTETPQSLAEESFHPEPGEWDDFAPNGAPAVKLR